MISGEIKEINPRFQQYSTQVWNLNIADVNDSGTDTWKHKKEKRNFVLSQIKHKCNCDNSDDGKCIHSFRLYLEYIKKFY